MSQRFYINWPLSPGPVELSGPEARHLATVSRLRAGDTLCLFNGDGHEYSALIVEVGKKSVSLEIQSVQALSRELSFELEIAAPVPKGDRAHFLIEKLTELGVTSFVPLLCERSVVQPGEGKIEKLERYVIEASKQCGRNVLMRIAEPIVWDDYVKTGEPGERRVLAHPTQGAARQFPQTAAAQIKTRGAVGPEGGFTEGEVAEALANGWQVVDLGPRILRIETAALVMAVLASGPGA
jgi:16S rRNA (uracil1498-N3)-methyltransferase